MGISLMQLVHAIGLSTALISTGYLPIMQTDRERRFACVMIVVGVSLFLL